MNEIELHVVVPKNRNLSGRMMIYKDHRPVREIEVLARGSRGVGDTQFLNNGNTPTGTYDGSVFRGSQDLPAASYGKWGVIRLKPVDGNALIAEQLLGRTGLLIHGGTLGGAGYWRGEGELRATHGCIRVSNDDMKFLRHLLLEDEERQMSRLKPPKVTVFVSE